MAFYERKKGLFGTISANGFKMAIPQLVRGCWHQSRYKLPASCLNQRRRRHRANSNSDHEPACCRPRSALTAGDIAANS